MNPGNDDGPIFIVGSGRSGTTLLAMLLNSTGEITCRRELGLVYHTLCDIPELIWRHFRDRSLLALKPTFDELLEREYGIAKDDFDKKIAGHPSRRRFLLSVYEETSSDRSLDRWGENTANDSLVMDLIVNAFPDASFIHMYRDPRDVALSGLGRSFGWPSLRAGYVHWFTLTRSVLRFQQHRPSRVLGVKYEDLLDEPREVLQRVRQSLDISSEVDMTDHYKPYDQKTLQPEYKRALDRDNKEKWRQLDDFNDSFALRLCGEEMEALGYLERDEYDFLAPWRSVRYWWEMGRRRYKPKLRTLLRLVSP